MLGSQDNWNKENRIQIFSFTVIVQSRKKERAIKAKRSQEVAFLQVKESKIKTKKSINLIPKFDNCLTIATTQTISLNQPMSLKQTKVD